MTADEKNNVDSKIEQLKSVYTKERCLQSYDRVIEFLINVIAEYYNKKSELDNAEDINSIIDIEYK